MKIISRRSVTLVCALFVLGEVNAAQIDVVVVDRQGKPIPGAVVTAYPKHGQSEVSPGSEIREDFNRYEVIQKGKEFLPDVLVVPVGAAVNFPNHDEVRHHVYSFSSAKPFEFELYGNHVKRIETFDKPGLVILGCNIHDSMTGYIYVNDAPFVQISDSDGRAHFDDIPASSAQIAVWHKYSKDVTTPIYYMVAALDDGPTEVLALDLRSERRKEPLRY